MTETPPFGVAGAETAPCRCGAAPHPEHAERCSNGHVLKGSALALVVGHRSRAFWAEHENARCELRDSIIIDAGHELEDAPRALAIAADGLAQAMLIRDSAFLRLVAAGGPLTSSGRTRRVFTVWCAALDRTERHLRLVGLKREPKPVPSLQEYLRERTEAASATRGDDRDDAGTDQGGSGADGNGDPAAHSGEEP